MSGNDGVVDVQSGDVSSFLCIDSCSEEEKLESCCGLGSIRFVDGSSLFIASSNHAGFDGIVAFFLKQYV